MFQSCLDSEFQQLDCLELAYSVFIYLLLFKLQSVQGYFPILLLKLALILVKHLQTIACKHSLLWTNLNFASLSSISFIQTYNHRLKKTFNLTPNLHHHPQVPWTSFNLIWTHSINYSLHLHKCSPHLN